MSRAGIFSKLRISKPFERKRSNSSINDNGTNVGFGRTTSNERLSQDFMSENDTVFALGHTDGNVIFGSESEFYIFKEEIQEERVFFVFEDRKRGKTDAANQEDSQKKKENDNHRFLFIA